MWLRSERSAGAKSQGRLETLSAGSITRRAQPSTRSLTANDLTTRDTPRVRARRSAANDRRARGPARGTSPDVLGARDARRCALDPGSGSGRGHRASAIQETPRRPGFATSMPSRSRQHAVSTLRCDASVAQVWTPGFIRSSGRPGPPQMHARAGLADQDHGPGSVGRKSQGRPKQPKGVGDEANAPRGHRAFRETFQGRERHVMGRGSIGGTTCDGTIQRLSHLPCDNRAIGPCKHLKLRHFSVAWGYPVSGSRS